MNNIFLIKITILGFVLIFIILAFVTGLIFLLPKKPATIVNVLPIPGAVNQKMFSTVSVVFSRPLSSSEMKKVTLFTAPIITGNSSWSSDKTAYNFMPPNGFNSLTTYKITFNYPWGTRNWSFTTIDFNNSPSDQAIQQGISDQKISKGFQDFYQKYPWYEQLPIQTSNYFIIFKADKNAFEADLYPLKNSTIPIDIQVANLKKEATQAIFKISSDTSKYPIEWTVLPQ